MKYLIIGMFVIVVAGAVALLLTAGQHKPAPVVHFRPVLSGQPQIPGVSP